MTKYVYIAGSYSADTTEGVEENVRRAIDVANVLISYGFGVFCPHLSHYLHERFPRDWDEWLRHDMLWLDRCDILLRIPGESRGADIEEQHAKEHGMDIYHHIKDLVGEHA